MSSGPLKFREKAYENLASLERLGRGEDGMSEPLTNVIASRAYYAAYLAVAHRAQQQNIGFAPEGYYQHRTLPNEAALHGILDDAGRDDLIYLRDMRVKADYWEDVVEVDEAEQAAETAEKLVRGLLP